MFQNVGQTGDLAFLKLFSFLFFFVSLILIALVNPD